MYDYVLMYGFDERTSSCIQSLKDTLKEAGIKDSQRKWPPHITIDLYSCQNRELFIQKLDKLTEPLKSFDIEFNNLNNFRLSTLYIQPYNTEELHRLKSAFDEELKEYRQPHRLSQQYVPHVTLCTAKAFQQAQKAAAEAFMSFKGTVRHIWMYSRKMELIKDYLLP